VHRDNPTNKKILKFMNIEASDNLTDCQSNYTESLLYGLIIFLDCFALFIEIVVLL
jgi:hypothetical protein